MALQLDHKRVLVIKELFRTNRARVVWFDRLFRYAVECIEEFLGDAARYIAGWVGDVGFEAFKEGLEEVAVCGGGGVARQGGELVLDETDKADYVDRGRDGVGVVVLVLVLVGGRGCRGRVVAELVELRGEGGHVDLAAAAGCAGFDAVLNCKFCKC